MYSTFYFSDKIQLYFTEMWRRIRFTKSGEKVNHLMYLDDIKIFAKRKREIETLIKKAFTTPNRNGVRNKEVWKTGDKQKYKWNNRTTKNVQPVNFEKALEERKLQISDYSGNWYNQIKRNKRNIVKGKNKKNLRKTQSNKYQDRFYCEIFRTLLKLSKWKASEVR